MDALTTWTLVLDVVLVLAVLGYAVGMYRTGFVAGALSFLGLLGGGLLVLWLLPGLLLDRAADLDPLRRGVVVLVGTLVGAALGQHLGALLGARVRALVRHRPARALDSWLGAVTAAVVAATLVWFVVGVIHRALPPPAAQTVAESRVLQGIDRAMPAAADHAFAGARRALDGHGFPRVFSGIEAEPIRPVEPPAPGAASGRGVEAAADSVVRVTGQAAECGRGQQGSGWVAAPERVVTNAHVLAGVDHPAVQIGGAGRTYPATTVAFDPRRDVAVLAVPGLPAEPLPTGPRLSHGDSIVVAGFPLGGPYDLETGRVRDLLTARGQGIDGTSAVDREVYSFRGRVEQGNSGGPILSPSGQVVGTVFATSLSDAATGYALTVDETRSVVEDAASTTREVSTGSCTS